MPTCWIIAGPNGAGKTTFALNCLPALSGPIQFINADLIASGLSPFAPDQEKISSSRIFLQRLKDSIEKSIDFAFETTLSGRVYLNLIDQLINRGFRVELIFLALPEIQTAKIRVSERVKHGGHNIPSKDIERRFTRSVQNLFNHYRNRVDHCLCLLNENNPPIVIFEQTGTKTKIHDQKLFQKIQKGVFDEPTVG